MKVMTVMTLNNQIVAVLSENAPEFMFIEGVEVWDIEDSAPAIYNLHRSELIINKNDLGYDYHDKNGDFVTFYSLLKEKFTR